MLDAAPRTKARSAICARCRMAGVIVSPRAEALRNAEPLTPIASIRLVSGNARGVRAALGRLVIWGQARRLVLSGSVRIGSDPGR